ncbi:MAG: ribose transport system permease protein [Kiritimatiellia bacterium]|jgi:ribose transport system permease protein
MNRLHGWTEYLVLALIWVGLILLFGALSDNFLTTRTFTTLAGRVPTLTVIAAGMTLVLIVAGIDLSVGSVLGLSGATLGLALTDWGWPLGAAALLCVAVGTLAGLVNGTLSVRLGIPSFIVTLGMLEAARGGAYLVTNSQTKYIGAAVEPLARPLPGIGLPLSFLIAILVVVIMHVVLTKTVFGRYLLAIGCNERALQYSGVNPRPYKVAVFVISGFLVGLGALFHTARLGSSDPNAGVGMELAAIAAVVIGGTSLMGGRGSVINSFLGVLIIATLEAGLAQIGATEPTKRVITGVVIVVAVAVDALRKRSRVARRQPS